jgi:acyl-[acyl-carrier-protein]-phospholipid O-acyltransferase / long-chain-fatty-acid--[acyl-carrier-protein] ligase
MKSFALRVFLWLLTKVFYRVTILHPENIPGQGGALLVSNHRSYVDMLLILASSRRPVRFLIAEEVCFLRLLKFPLRLLGVIPLPVESRARELTEALRLATEAILRGELVGIFPERSVSRIGLMLPFRRDFERIMKGVEAPIIPVGLDGLWGSIFSYQGGRFFWKLPRRIPYPVTVSFGEPMSPNSTALQVRTAIQLINAESWSYRRRTMQPLGRAFVSTARRHPFRFAIADERVPKMNFASALMRTLFLARRLTPFWEGQNMVGVFLPPSVGGALVNLAALLAGRVPVNLNYTLKTEGLASCARQCELQTIVTSRKFLDRVKINLPGRLLMLEEIIARPRIHEKLAALALAWLAPVRLVERVAGCRHRPQLDDLATVVFSSGSTGDPKGVMLSHYNLASNVTQLSQTYDFAPRDRFLGILPFFHSFGFTATLLVPAVYGVGVAYHPNPLNAKPIGELVRRYRLTYLMATPSFLQIYLRACAPEDFGSLRFVMAGAEKLRERLVADFEEKFGIRPVEGYGCTECGPVVSANRLDFRAPGFRQRGSRVGRIGHPLPGIAVRIVQPETRALLAPGEPGLLLVRGPNIMQGYLNRPDKTAQVLRDGWYETGDMAVLDEDGFLQITGRLSRFSKIGGEMAPHELIEEKLEELAGAHQPTFAVTGVPDERKGERLVVLHALTEPALSDFLRRLTQLDLPSLWVPKANQFFAVDALPLLGNGKLDLRTLRERAIALSRERDLQQTEAA